MSTTTYTKLDTIHADAELATRWAVITETGGGWALTVYSELGRPMFSYTARDIQRQWNRAITHRAGEVHVTDAALAALTTYAPAA